MRFPIYKGIELNSLHYPFYNNSCPCCSFVLENYTDGFINDLQQSFHRLEAQNIIVDISCECKIDLYNAKFSIKHLKETKYGFDILEK